MNEELNSELRIPNLLDFPSQMYYYYMKSLGQPPYP